MNQMIRALVLITFAFHSAIAQSSPSAVRASELKKHPFNVDGLLITIRKLDGQVITSEDVRDTGVGYMVVRLENGTSNSMTFEPSRLVVVGKDGKQASIAYERRTTDRVVPHEITVAPKAYVEVRYNLSERVKFPAKLYYGERLLTEVTG